MRSPASHTYTRNAPIQLPGLPTATRRGWTSWPTTSPWRARCWTMLRRAHGAVRPILIATRGVYDRQDFHFAGDYTDSGFLEV